MIKKLFSIILIAFSCFLGIENVRADDTIISNSSSQTAYITTFGETVEASSVFQDNRPVGTSNSSYFLLEPVNCGVSSCVYNSLTQINLFIYADLKPDTYYIITSSYNVGGYVVTDFTNLNANTSCNLLIGGAYNGGIDSCYTSFDYSNNTISTTIHTTTSSSSVRFNYGNHTLIGAYNTPITNLFTNPSEYQQGVRINNVVVSQTNDVSGSINIIQNQIDILTNSTNETNRKLDSLNDTQKETNDTLKDDNVDESTSEATEFFEGFDTDTHGLTSIITAPLELIGNIADSSCSPLPLQVPFVNKTMSLPCMSTIYKKHFGSFLTIYQTITFGIVAYWVCVRIFALVKDFKNPEHDEIEVMDL